MPNDLNYLPEKALHEIFDSIGKAKEDTAKGIRAEQAKERDDARKRRQKMFGGGGSDTAMDELERMQQELEREIEATKLGMTLAEYDAKQRGEEAPKEQEAATIQDDVIELDFDDEELAGEPDDPQSAVVPESIAEPAPEFISELTAEPVPEVIQSEPPKAEIKPEPKYTLIKDGEKDDFWDESIDIIEDPLDKIAPEVKKIPFEGNEGVEKVIVPVELVPEDKNLEPEPENEDTFEILGALDDSFVAHLSVGINASTKESAYAFAVIPPGGKKVTHSESFHSIGTNRTAFKGATELFKAIGELDLKSVVVCADESYCALLQRNAAFGMQDGYSKECEDYIAEAKSTTAKRYIRFSFDMPANDKVRAYTKQAVEFLIKGV